MHVNTTLMIIVDSTRKRRKYPCSCCLHGDISIDDARAYELEHGINAPAGVGPRATLVSDAPQPSFDTTSITNEPSTSVATSPTAPSSSSATNGAGTETANPPRTLTFVELQALIEAGRVDEIPNNREIPDKLNVRLYSFLSYPACHGLYVVLASSSPSRSSPS